MYIILYTGTSLRSDSDRGIILSVQYSLRPGLTAIVVIVFDFTIYRVFFRQFGSLPHEFPEQSGTQL